MYFFKGAENFLVKAYPTHDIYIYIYAGNRHRPDKEHETSSIESEHEHDSEGEAEQEDEVSGIAEETFLCLLKLKKLYVMIQVIGQTKRYHDL